MWSQECYLKAMKFAALAHADQRIPGSELPYVVHLAQVAMEIMALPDSDDFALSCALLHDTIEDTQTGYEVIGSLFGDAVAEGVLALTKNTTLPKSDQMPDSLRRIKLQPKQVWMVKLADRITNMQQPPAHWDKAKRLRYREEAETILRELQQAHPRLSARLEQKISDYGRWC